MIKEFIKYYKPYKKLFFVDFISAVIAAALEIIFPIIVNKVLREYLPNENLVLIITAVIALLGFYVINAIMQYIVTYFGHKLGHLIERDMRLELFTHLTNQSFSFYNERKTGELMSRMTTDLFEIGEVAHHGPEDIFIAISTTIVTIFLIFRIHPMLAILTLFLVPIITYLIIIFNKKMTKVNSKIYGNLANFNSGLENTISGIRVVKAFSNEDYEIEKFKLLNEEYRESKMKFYRIMGISYTTNHFLLKILGLVALLSGSYFYVKGYIKEYSDIIYFILLSNVLVRPIEKMNAVIESYPKGIAGFKRFLELKNIKTTIFDSKNAISKDELKGNIKYENVSFSYDSGKEILSSINLEIKDGQTVAFVGPSGAGKTTLCNLLPRFYNLSEGKITIDDQDISNIKLKSLRNNIGIVEQDVFLFNGTVEENIRYGKKNATKEEVLRAIRLSQLEEVIKELKEGVNTIIGDRGVKLSGGQKQRIAIARMFLKDPKILILDEATSALDTKSESLIQEALNKLSKGRTTLVIAHRLSTIKNADVIFVVTKNGILERGSHTELMNKKGIYESLYRESFDL